MNSEVSPLPASRAEQLKADPGERERFLDEVDDHGMQLDIPLDDPLWKRIDQASCTREHGLYVHVDMHTGRRMYDPLVDMEVKEGALTSPFLSIRSGAIHEIALWGKGARTKTYSGDALALSSRVNRETGEWSVDGECRDGVTEMPQEQDRREKLLSRLRLLIPEVDTLPADQIANRTIREMRSLLEKVLLPYPTTQRDIYSALSLFDPDDHSLGQMLSKADIREAQIRLSMHRATDRYGKPRFVYNPAAYRWIENNVLLGLAYGTFADRMAENAMFPSTSGSVVQVFESYAPSQTAVAQSSVADGVEVLVYTSGQISLTGISTNFQYDKETVLAMRGLMSTGECQTIEEARTVLRKRGHYDQSYQRKRKGMFGQVAVCDGSFFFADRVYGAFPSIGFTQYALARFYVSDGMLAPFWPIVGQPDRKGIVTLVKKLLQGDRDLVDFVESHEESSLLDDDGLPTREKLADDKSALGFVFQPKNIVNRILPDLKLVG